MDSNTHKTVPIVPHFEAEDIGIPNLAQNRPVEFFGLTGGLCPTHKGVATCGTTVWSLRP